MGFSSAACAASCFKKSVVKYPCKSIFEGVSWLSFRLYGVFSVDKSWIAKRPSEFLARELLRETDSKAIFLAQTWRCIFDASDKISACMPASEGSL